MSAQHTPTPFRAEWINGTWYALHPDGSALSNRGRGEERDALLEIAAHAAELECDRNVHDELVAALREIAGKYGEKDVHNGGDATVYASIARAALAKVQP